MDDGLGDWRIAVVAHATRPKTGALGGYEENVVVARNTPTIQAESGDTYGYTSPSATAMALNIAINASKNAERLYAGIEHGKLRSPSGPTPTVSPNSLTELYDFFEQCMISVTFSYQALEVFCNEMIIRELKESLRVKRRRKWHLMSPLQLERELGPYEKLAQVLPKLRKVPTPKGKSVWEPFEKLKSARDDTIHLKYQDQQPVDEKALFIQFLSHKASPFPAAAAEMIRYFSQDNEPRWLELLPL